LLAELADIAGAAADAHYEMYGFRNRIGLFWPEDGSEQEIEANGGQWAASLLFQYYATVVDKIGVQGDYVLAAVDPRWNQGLWKSVI
jgi:hypothetical protein